LLKHARRGKKFHIAAVFEEQLKVFGIEPKLTHRAADFIGNRRIGGGARPTIAAAGMFEFQMAAIGEIQRRACERDVHCIACSVCSSVIREVHDRRVTKQAATQSEILGEEKYVYRTVCHLAAAVDLRLYGVSCGELRHSHLAHFGGDFVNPSLREAASSTGSVDGRLQMP
jgi:hypothetical protein